MAVMSIPRLWDRGGTVGIATCYGQEIEFRWVRQFSHPSKSTLEPTSLPYSGYRVSFSGVNWPGCGDNHLSQSNTEVKERVAPYPYSLSDPLWLVLERNFPFIFNYSVCTVGFIVVSNIFAVCLFRSYMHFIH
jgi:hypothetical protein